MKSITVLAFTAFLSTTAFAQDYIKCEMKIPDNKVGCFLSFANCPENKLKDSKSELNLILHNGEQISGTIRFNHVVLHPGTKKEKKNHVYLFQDDLRHEKVRDDEKVDLVAYEAESGIDYTARKDGSVVSINFKTSQQILNYSLEGTIGFSSYLLTPYNAVLLKCDKMNKEVFEAGDRKRKAIEEHLKKKKEEKSDSNSARNE